MSAPGTFSRADRALVALSLARPTGVEVEAARSLLEGLEPAGAAELAEKIAFNDVAPQVLLNVARHDLPLPLPAASLEAMRQRRSEVAARNERRRLETIGLLEDLAAAGVQVVLLKGVLFALTMWEDPGYKKMNDLDVLIHAEDIAATVEVYRRRGYVPLVLFEGGDPDAVDPAKTHHLPSFVSRDLQFVVGTHWDLAGRKSGVRLDVPRMWLDSQPVDYHGAPARALAPLDNLVHLAVHFHHYKTGVKELADIYNYARFVAPVPWPRLAARLVEVGAAGRGYYCLSLAHELQALGDEEPVARFLTELRDHADEFRVADADLRLARRHLLTSSRSLYEGTIEKAFTRFMVETRFHRKLWWALVFWWRLLFPPAEVLARTNVEASVTRSSWPRLWLANLGRTGRVLQATFGQHPWLAAAAVTVAWTAQALPNYLRPPPFDGMEELRRAIGGDPGKVQALMDFLE